MAPEEKIGGRDQLLGLVSTHQGVNPVKQGVAQHFENFKAVSDGNKFRKMLCFGFLFVIKPPMAGGVL